MNETQMVDAMEDALRRLDVHETIEAVGQFQPRGHNGAMFAGGLVGNSLTGALGDIAESMAAGAGSSLAGVYVHDAASGLPANMLVGVSSTHVYRFAATGRLTLKGLVFRVERDALTVTVHQRLNVRVVELADAGTGHTIELEGNRMPVAHTKDVIDLLLA
jgi:hypothetical protein